MDEKFRIVNGSIFDSPADILVHQVNCKGVMGAGLAKQFRVRYPEMYAMYRFNCNTSKPEDLLGKVLYYSAPDGKLIANIYAQNGFGSHGRHTDYEALKSCLSYVKETAEINGFTVAVPYNLGCGLGGGDWNEVYRILCEVFEPDMLEIRKL